MALKPLSRSDPAEVGGYRLQGRLGSGGMGVVFLASGRDGRPVAVKVMRPDLGDDAQFRARFRHEIEAARRVSGQFTAQVLDADPEAPQPWLVTAYVEGPSLSEAVDSHGPLPEASVLSLLAGVAQALTAIHAAGLIHRDLKPSNVLLAADGPRVIDFGIVRASGVTSVTRTGKVAGSPHYMAPEQARGDAITPSADIWALGALGCFAATGRPPFGEGTEAALLYRLLHDTPNLSGCPPQVAGILGACLNRDPAARPSSAQVMEWCQPGQAGRTPEYRRDWLPPALAADLAGHALPTALPTPSATPPRSAQFPQQEPRVASPGIPAPGVSGPGMPAPGVAGPGMPAAGMGAGTAPGMGAGMAAPEVAGPGTPAPGMARPGTPAPGMYRPEMTGPGAVRMPGGPVPGTATPVPPAGTGWPGMPRQRRSHAVLFGVAASVVVLAVLIGLAVFLSRNKPSAALDPCLVGTWTVTGETVDVSTDGENVQFLGGNGYTLTISSDGHSTETWDNSQLTAVVAGVMFEDITNGTASYDVRSSGDQLIVSHQSVRGSVKLLDNGSVQSTMPLMLDNGKPTYTCSGNTLRVTDSGVQGANSSHTTSTFVRAG